MSNIFYWTLCIIMVIHRLMNQPHLVSLTIQVELPVKCLVSNKNIKKILCFIFFSFQKWQNELFFLKGRGRRIEREKKKKKWILISLEMTRNFKTSKLPTKHLHIRTTYPYVLRNEGKKCVHSFCSGKKKKKKERFF